MKTSVYLIMGGNAKDGIYFLPQFFNYKKNALAFRKKIQERHPLKVVKFISEEIK